MIRSLAPGLLAVPAFLATAASQSPCLPQGLTLSTSPGRLGDEWTLALNGRPSAFGLLGFDFAPGPVVTPIGTICLGLTPSLSTLAFFLDPAGSLTLRNVLPWNAGLAGLTVHMAAAALDSTQPSGFAISNGASLTLREPRLFVVAPGSSTPFGSLAGSFAALDLTSDTVPFSRPLPGPVRDAIFVRELGQLVVLLNDGTIAGFDGVTGAPMFSLPAAASVATVSLHALPGGNVLLLEAGTRPNPFSQGTPGGFRVVALPSGTIANSLTLPSGNPEALLLVPGTPLAVLRLLNSVVVVDYVAGIAYPEVLLPGGFGNVADWQLAGSDVFLLHSGQAATPFSTGLPAAISAVDLGTLTVRFTSQLLMNVPVTLLRAGLGTTGPSLFVYGDAAGSIEEFSQATATATGTIGVGAGVTAMELSALGSQWLVLCNSGACGGPALLAFPVTTTSIATLAPLLATQPQIAVSPSSGTGKACLFIGNNLAAPFRTDPFVPAASVTLPVSAGLFIVVSD